MALTAWTLTVWMLAVPACWGLSVIHPPNDTLVVLDPPRAISVTLGCQVPTNSTVFQWKFTSSNTGFDGLSIFQLPRRSVEPVDRTKYRVTNSYDLTVLDVQMTDTGFYTCRVDNDPRSAQLVVISQPRLMMYDMAVEENSLVSFRCDLEVAGVQYEDIPASIKPTIEVKLGSMTIDSVFSVPSGSVYNLSATGEIEVTSAMASQELQCTVRTKEGGQVASVSQRLNVAYSPRNFTFHPMKADYAVGEVISCHAMSNPEPEYKWHVALTSNNLTFHGQRLTVNDHMATAMLTSTCVALYNDVPYTEEFTFQITGGGVGPTDPTEPMPDHASSMALASPLVIVWCLSAILSA